MWRPRWVKARKEGLRCSIKRILNFGVFFSFKKYLCTSMWMWQFKLIQVFNGRHRRLSFSCWSSLSRLMGLGPTLPSILFSQIEVSMGGTESEIAISVFVFVVINIFRPCKILHEDWGRNFSREILRRRDPCRKNYSFSFF